MKCKRCQATIKPYSHLIEGYGCANGIRFMQIYKGGQISCRPIPLCKKCITEVENWLENKEVKANDP